MKKAIILLLAAAACALCLVSCKKDNTSTVYVEYQVTPTGSTSSFMWGQVQSEMKAAIKAAVTVDAYGLSVESDANDKAVIAACDAVAAKPLDVDYAFSLVLRKAYLSSSADSEGKTATLKVYTFEPTGK